MSDIKQVVIKILEGVPVRTALSESKDTIKISGKDISYVVDRNPKGEVTVEIGDGELTDTLGDDFFIHLEYDPDKNDWVEEIWYYDDHLNLKDAPDFMGKANIATIRNLEKQLVSESKSVFESDDPTEENPMKIDAPRGEYWVWKALGEIYGSATKPDPKKNIVDARATTNFSQQGFDDLEEVIDYIKKYF
jgi:hypothetical protein